MVRQSYGGFASLPDDGLPNRGIDELHVYM